jgi:hypothetical protein
MIVDTDREVRGWVFGILHNEPTKSGDFLGSLAVAVVKADDESYAALRPGLLILKARFPKYDCRCNSFS